MTPFVRRLLLVAAAAASAAFAQTVPKPFTEYTPAELTRAVPSLAALQPASSQAALAPILKAAGDATEEMLVNFVAASAAEDIHELRFDRFGPVIQQQEHFRYVARYVVRSAEATLDEFRVSTGNSKRAEPHTAGAYIALDGFVKLLNHVTADYRGMSQFRYLGTLDDGPRKFNVVAFLQNPGSHGMPSHVITPAGDPVRLHGILWIDTATHRVDRVYTEIAERPQGFPLESLATDIVYTSIAFPRVDGQLWMPARVIVHGRFEGGEAHSVHRFSDYRAVDDAANAKDAGAVTASAAAVAAEDGWEVLARALTLPDDRKSEAPALFAEAIRLAPEQLYARYHLASSMLESGDLAGAEAQLRQARDLHPGEGPVRNLLGVALFKRGDAAAAAAEFREAARLQPKDASVQFNLAQALERTGDRAGALAALETAAGLAPANAAISSRIQAMRQTPAAAAPPETTIRVDVRQVLVPVIVTDRDGHHVSGLKQSDFRVFEDGVEQSITAFSAENAGVANAELAPPEQGSTGELASRMAPAPTPMRRVYVVCIDTVHSGFGGFNSSREALRKMFQAERPGDARYVLIALGDSYKVLQDSTADPALVLKVLESQDFQKHFLASQRSNVEAEIRQFRSNLDRAYSACLAHDPSCPALKRALPPEADRIADQDRISTTGYLRQLRSLVDQMSRAPGRRSLILLSDGFDLVPGKLAYNLLTAYFPEMQFASLRSVDRLGYEFEPVVRAAAKGSVTINTIDSRGLYTSSFYNASQPGGAGVALPGVQSALSTADRDSGVTLQEFAAATGGTAYQNNNDLFRGVYRAFADGREYYMLSYVSPNAKADGKFRAITVRLRDSKLNIKTKRGYWSE